MADTLTESGSLYSAPVGLIYVFNLIVGTGALTMPKAFGEAGWLISLITVIALAFMSYLTVTFMIEAMSNANAIRRLRKEAAIKEGIQPIDESSDTETITDEQTPMLADASINRYDSAENTPKSSLFNITERIEMGQLATMFFNKLGRTVFCISLAVYLYGDLAIYAAAVPKSLRDVACTYYLNDTQLNGTNHTRVLNDRDPCWTSAPHISRLQAYRIFLACFAVTLGPFVFFNIQKTKYLQIFTTLMRWLAFSLMIVLAVIYLARGQGLGKPRMGDIFKVPNLFGVCVYSFMCHHSLPSLATPIKNKNRLFSLFAMDYSLILSFYCVLSFTGIFVFPTDCLKDLYTLNFKPDHEDDCHEPMTPITTLAFIQYYLALFPVFTLGTNFPIIGITLRNNLKTFFHKDGRSYVWFVDRIVFPLAALLPPLAIACITDNIQFLVSITGSFAGSGIQYFVPASLVLLSRRDLSTHLGEKVHHKHTSPFRHRYWPRFVFMWAVVCIALISISHLMNWIHGKF